MKRLKLLVILSGFLLYYTNVAAQTIEEKTTDETALAAARLAQYRQTFWDSLPIPLSWTNDYIGLFSVEQRDHLDSLITDFEKKTTAEIGIVTLDTFCVSIENFDALATHIGSAWGMGKKDKNNGIIICISPLYRRIRISNGSGIQKYLSDEETQAIIDNNMIPHFREGNYIAGTAEGLKALIEKLTARLKPD